MHLGIGAFMRATWLLLAACCCASAQADEAFWNQYRGPHGDGSTTAGELPVTFGEGSPEIAWKTPIPGRGWSSPVIWGNQVWLTYGPEVQNLEEGQDKLDRPLKLSALCIDLETGRIERDLVLFEVDRPQFTHATNSYASPTPYIEEGRVYLHFGAYGTACLDTHTGQKLWERRDLPCDHFRGPGSSPVVYGDLIYLTMDGYDFQYLAALDKRTGEIVWKRDRGIDFGTSDGDAKKAYSTPTLIEVEGRSLLVSPFAAATIAYDPLTGEPLWTVRHGGMNAAARPLFGHGLVYINSADGPSPLVAVRPNGAGDITGDIAWQASKGVPKRSSQLLVGDLLLMMNDSGVATCLDATTGEEIWTERVGGDYWASPLLADGLVYCFSQDGTVPVFRASREFELVAENHLDDGFIASPAVADRALILRTAKHLYRIQRPAASAAQAAGAR
jgi:outer membrane protein assembly factor BamB